MTRTEQWAKDRALEYTAAGDVDQAFASMLSDLGKHRELVDHPGKEVGGMLYATGHLRTPAQMEQWIKGFN